jgi:hypothetical protein
MRYKIDNQLIAQFLLFIIGSLFNSNLDCLIRIIQLFIDLKVICRLNYLFFS